MIPGLHREEKFCIDLIAGARPNFMKIAPIIHAIQSHNAEFVDRQIAPRLIHTGQHYDQNMSGSFFEQLNIPEPDLNLGAGSGSQAVQTGQIMTGYEQALIEKKPHLCLVVGDVNSTLACAIVAKKAGVLVAHVEAGIRSGDWSMPEEINRIVTDSITNFFFTTSELAGDNLLKAGHSSEQIFFVGNTMIDSLYANLEKLKMPAFFTDDLKNKPYLVLTLHRPANVDTPEKLKEIMVEILNAAQDTHIIFPMHPRTRKIFAQLNLQAPHLQIVDPLPYLEFMFVVRNSIGVVTDSGGITEETSVLNIPCMTIRDSTERPETITFGSNVLVRSTKEIGPLISKMICREWKQASSIPMWDGKTGRRIVDTLVDLYFQ